MKTGNWLAVTLVAVLVLCLGLALGAGLLGYGIPGGMMGRWGGYAFPGGMIGGRGWGVGGLLAMGLMWLIPLGFLALLVLGIVGLVRTVSSPVVHSTPVQPAPVQSCPDCHKQTQADWQNCPYCGKSLKP
jgi:hypothetical protein